jgi:Amt family ammonium transporter
MMTLGGWRGTGAALLAVVAAVLTPGATALAQAAAPAAPAASTATAFVLNSGDTAWMLTSTALVLMMTIPGLALFYGGMVRKKNVLATLMQSFAICCLVTVTWFVVGYSLAFTSGNAYVGDLSQFMLQGFGKTWDKDFLLGGTVDTTIPESVYMMFQMTFAIITPALICGAFADRGHGRAGFRGRHRRPYQRGRRRPDVRAGSRQARGLRAREHASL